MGGLHYNSVKRLEALEIWDNEHILYNFHFNSPYCFTHQRVTSNELKDSNIHQPCPGKIAGVDILKRLLPHENWKADTVYEKNYLLNVQGNHYIAALPKLKVIRTKL